ncbi:hypothetical protein DAI22_04g104500 [Oryza sativa Japonica Group]|nr:hypothetical protein DAI22_04g104500 [Oryza sativa Japonica Group]
MSIGPTTRRQQPAAAVPSPSPPPPPPPVVDVRAVRQQTAEQMRQASAHRAYAERVREMARAELELAEREFARARAIWERAREEVERVERMKEIAARRLGIGPAAASAALEITCHACMQRFHP